MGLLDFLKKKDAIPYEKIAEQLDVFTKESLAMPKMNNPFLLKWTAPAASSAGVPAGMGHALTSSEMTVKNVMRWRSR